MADMNFTLKINEASKFNSGEFEGWGTSLCWWANRLGYNKNLINQAVDKFYSPNGLDLNIGRYNIGGGDHVKETFHTPYHIDRSNKKVVYDLRTSGLKPEYFGTNMSISSYDMSTARYTRSDSDFGITSGSTVGTIEYVGYINRLDSMASFGGNLRYRNINVTNSGLYIVKFLLALEGENNRNIAIRVNDVSKYSIDKDRINNNAIATNGNRTIYLVEFDGVYLSQGVNTIDFGSNTTDWCLDVIKMAVVRSKEDDYYRDWYDVPPNKKADIYDCLDHRQSIKTGSAMGNFFLYDLYNATYSKSDANFGIQAGETIKNLYAFNNINKLDDVADTGGNATFNVDIKEADKYDIILMLTLEGTNDRDMAIKVNGTKYSVGTDTINNNVIASANNRKMYIATFYEIHLNRGVNTITIGGDTGWGLDFVKMCVVKTTAYGVLPENDDFLHNAHINRSDSVVPGYCTDVCKINTNEHNIEWYHKNFERVDEECGYAWNYDWNADRYQMNILKAIAKQRGEDFIAEAFSNSPPYFMTNSGCSSGANDSSKNNLRDNAYNAFAKYLADVIAHFNLRDDEVTFTSATGMNEPYTNYWGANSNKQEGCHFDQGYSQSRVIRALNWNLKDKGVNDCIISGTDETSIDTAISSYNALDQYAKETISRIDTHTYSGSDRTGLRQLAENEGKNLWMSEVDGDFTHGTNAGEMSAALGLAHRIIEDLMWMKPSAWILWDIVDMHCDTGNVHDGNDFSWLNTSGGYWGLTACNHDDEYIWCLKKYYAFGQFTRYIRPGYTIFPIDWNSLGAYDRKNNKVVIVAMNTEASDKSAWFSFEQFGTMNTTNITAIRTSGALDGGENWADVSSSCNIWLEKNSKWFTADLKANSITTFIVDNVKLESPSDLSTQVIMYKHKKQLTPVSGTPTAGQYSVTITSTINCTAQLESDHKTISLLSATSNDGKINISINVENVKTYNKSISVASIISNEIVHESIVKQSQLKQNLDGFKSTVSATYQTKDDMSDYSTISQMNSAIDQKAESITQSVSSTYATKTSLKSANDNITSLTNRMQSAESKLTKDSLTTTIGKYYTTSTDVDGIITNKGYATTSQVNQTATDLTVKFSSAGGYNMVRNGGFILGTNCWTDLGGGIARHSSTSTRTGIYVDTVLPKGFSGDWIKISNGKYYTFSAKVWVANTDLKMTYCTPLDWITNGTASGGHQGGYIDSYTFSHTTIPHGKWVDIWLTFKCTKDGYFRPQIKSESASDTMTISIADIMITEGKVVLPWSPHPYEIYDGINQIDKYGIKVYHTDIDSNSYTHISSSGFYLKHKGSDIFKLDNNGLYINGNAATATKLQTTRSINGTFFDGSANITTANWGTARTITIGNSGKSVNGSGNVSWSLNEIGASNRSLNKNNYTRITVNGNANTYYPVLINFGKNSYPYFHLNISRAYSWDAPNTWYNSTHKGGLTLSVRWTGDNNWGGNDKNIIVEEFNETYSTMVAGLALSVDGLIVWLRGGGALYQLDSEYGVSTTATITLGSYTAADKTVYAVRTNTDNVTNEIRKRWIARGTSGVFDNNNRVYSASNKPTPADIGAAAASHGNHVPATQSADNKKFLRNDNTWQVVSPANIGAVPTGTGGNITIHADNDASSTSEYALIKAGHNELKVASSAGGGTVTRGQDKLTFNGNIVYHAGRKPTLSELGAAASNHSHSNYAASSHEHNYLNVKGTNTINSTANDTTAKWGAHKNSVHWYTEAGKINDQPSQWGYLVNIGQDSEVHQVWMTQSSGDLLHRGGNGSGWSGSWRTILDSSNYSTWAAAKSHSHNYAGSSSAGGNANAAVKLATARTLTIGNKGKNFDGSGNVSWSLSEIGAAAANHTHNYAASNHNHDSAYLKLSGGTLTGALTTNGSVTAKGGVCVSKNSKEAWLDIGDNDTYIWASGANKSIQITHSGDLNFDGKPVLYGGRGNNYDTATSTIYFNNAGASHKGRISCYKDGSNKDYVQTALRTANDTTNYVNIYEDSVKVGSNNICLNGKKLTIATSAPSGPATGDVWINIG